VRLECTLEDAAAAAARVRATVPPPASVAGDVAAIVAAVRERGDDALREYESRFGDATPGLVPPGELAAALDAHRERIDLPQRRLRSRRASALREFTAENGDRAMRALGGRREVERLLAAQDGGLSVNALVASLEAQA
jgi:histidinol dehydrogenase